MFFGLLLILFGLFILWLLIDFLIITGDVNKFFEKWAYKTLWIWLPFYALQRLIKEVILKKK